MTDVNRALVRHLVEHALRTDGPFRLASGAVSDWYLDARQTTFDGEGARLVARAVEAVLLPEVVAIGGMTMGADPIAVATATLSGRSLRAFSVRKAVKGHGTGGRLVGPVNPGDRVAVLEDTMTTGGSTAEAIEVLRSEDIEVVQAITLVDRSDGAAGSHIVDLGVAFVALATPADLGVG